jgi:hypothetical protein
MTQTLLVTKAIAKTITVRVAEKRGPRASIDTTGFVLCVDVIARRIKMQKRKH